MLLAKPLGVVKLLGLMLGLVKGDEVIQVLLDAVHTLLGIVVGQGKISRML